MNMGIWVRTGAKDPGHGRRRPCFSPQEPCDRLLLLYPNSLAIFSEEPDGLCFKVRRAPKLHTEEEVGGAAGQEEPVCQPVCPVGC